MAYHHHFKNYSMPHQNLLYSKKKKKHSPNVPEFTLTHYKKNGFYLFLQAENNAQGVCETLLPILSHPCWQLNMITWVCRAAGDTVQFTQFTPAVSLGSSRTDYSDESRVSHRQSIHLKPCMITQPKGNS